MELHRGISKILDRVHMDWLLATRYGQANSLQMAMKAKIVIVA